MPLTTNELVFIGAGAAFGYYVGGPWFALIGGALGYAMLFGAQWALDQSVSAEDFEVYGPPLPDDYEPAGLFWGS